MTAKKKKKRSTGPRGPVAPAKKREEIVPIESLKPHPKNYRIHPEVQILHIGSSLKQHGFYRNVVVARDFTILAGHGVVEAAKKVGIRKVPIFRLDVDPESPVALKVLAGDNEIPRLAESDDGGLGEILNRIQQADAEGLLGTGYDDLTLGRLLAIGEPPIDPMAEWAGMPEFDQKDKTAARQIVINFKSDADASAFGKLLGQTVTPNTRSLWYPEVEIERLMDKRYKREG